MIFNFWSIFSRGVLSVISSFGIIESYCWCFRWNAWNLVNDEINYQPQLVSWISEPSTVSFSFHKRLLKVTGWIDIGCLYRGCISFFSDGRFLSSINSTAKISLFMARPGPFVLRGSLLLRWIKLQMATAASRMTRPWTFGASLLLMVQKSSSPVEVGSLSRYFQGFSTIPCG